MRVQLSRSFLKRFWRFIGPKAIKWTALASLASLGLTVVELAIAGCIQLLVVSLGAIPDINQLPSFMQHFPKSTTFVGLMLVGIAGCRALLQLVQGYGNFMIRESVLVHLRMTLLHQMLRSAGGFVRTADVQTRLSEIFPKASVCAYYVVNGMISALQTIALAGMLFWMSPMDSLVAMVGVVLVGLATQYSSVRLKSLAARMPLAQMKLNEGLNRVARNWLYVKVMRTEQREFSELEKQIYSYNDASVKGIYLTNVNGAVAPFLGVVLIVVIVHLSQHVWKTPGLEVLSFLYMLVRFINSLTMAVNAHSSVSLNLPQLTSAMDYSELFEKRKENVSQVSLGENLESMPQLHGMLPRPPNIRLKGVGVRFHKDGPAVLDDVSLVVEGGSQLGILGPSGAGKTTLLNVLLGILEPTVGKAFVGDFPAKEVFERGIFKIGYVGPDPMLIEGTIRENLLYGAKSLPTDEELWFALGQAMLDDKIRQLPQGLNQPLNEHADILSAGQKQRLALARALVGHPDILILDEASANLDETTEAEIAKSILGLKGKCTTLIVSHRPGILKNSDQIYEVKKH